MLELFVEFKDWIIGGSAIIMPLLFIGWRSGRFTKQSQKSGNNSINMQAGANGTFTKNQNKNKNEKTNSEIW